MTVGKKVEFSRLEKNDFSRLNSSFVQKFGGEQSWVQPAEPIFWQKKLGLAGWAQILKLEGSGPQSDLNLKMHEIEVKWTKFVEKAIHTIYI